MLQNPAGLYQGTPNLNPLPYVNIAIQARQRKQAREDAIDKYYRQLPDTVNDKGLRDQEVPIINDYKNKIFSFGVKNREKLRNPKIDNGAAQLTLDKLIREAHGVARNSQNAAKDDLEIGKMWFNKDYQDVINNEDFIKQHDAHNLPVTDPNYKPLNMAEVTQLKPFDQAGYAKEVKGLFPYDVTTTRVTDPTNPLLDIETATPKLGEDAKKGIYAYAAEKLHNSSTFRKHISKELAGTGQLPILNEISQRVFGHPLDSDEDIAAAYTVSQMQTTSKKEKPVTDIGAVMDKRRKEGMEDWRTKNKITFGQSMAKIAANKAAGTPPEDTGYLSDNVADEVGETQTIRFGNDKSEKRVIYVDKIDPERLNIISGRDLSKKQIGVEPIAIKQPDGSVKMGYYQDLGTGDWEGKGGQKISRERVKDDYIKTVSPSKFKVQAGTKASENTKNPKVKKTTKSGLPVFH